MKILVHGAGAVGGYLGARLQRAGHEVTLVCRPLAAATIAAAGLTVLEPDVEGGWRAHPRAVASLAAALADGADGCDLVIAAMKAYDVPAALAEMAPLIPPSATLLAVQNGIGVEALFAARLGAKRLVAGSVTIPLSQPATATLQVERAGRGLALAPVTPGEDVTRWRDLFSAAGIATTMAADHQSLKWSKALLNMVGNATSAILDRPPAFVYRHRASFRLERAMLRETLDVMQARRIPVIDLPGSPARWLARGVRWLPGVALQPLLTRLVARGRGDKLPSFLLDLEAGKAENEVGYHNGAVARAAAADGLAAPVNAALAAILLDLVAGRRPRERLRGRPEALAAAVAAYAAGSVAHAAG